jgi:hypothetical protein
MAMIISGDTDLIPPIRHINIVSEKNKRAFVAFPPNRVNDEVRDIARGSLVIGRKNIADSQFPNVVGYSEQRDHFIPGQSDHSELLSFFHQRRYF